jgi:cytochrome c oxidase cbb3-type subunit III
MRPQALAIAFCLTSVAAMYAQAPGPQPIANPTPDDLSKGAKAFGTYCSRCHGIEGTGGMGPPLARARLRRATDGAGIIAILVNGVPGTAMAPAFWLSEPETAQVAAYVASLGKRSEERLPGDPARGREVYAGNGCAACHVTYGEGLAVGPELSDIGSLRGSAFLRESILVPGASHPERPVPYEPYGYPGYLIVRAQPKSGPEIRGIRINEDAFTIQIRDEQRRVQSLRKDDLERLVVEPATSLMPSYRDTVKGRDLDDLVAYLMTCRVTR